MSIAGLLLQISVQKVYKASDINGDEKIGLEEMIYFLQDVSGIR